MPQNFLLDGGRRIQLTKNVDPHEDLTKARVERFTVERADGFKFRVKVTLPSDYKAGTRLPAIFWFYPREFTSQDEYDRPDRTFNKNDFTNFGASCSSVPPLSPIITTACVSASFWKASRQSLHDVPLMGSPPIRTLVVWRMAAWVSCYTIS